MGYKTTKLRLQTHELLDLCIKEYLKHHPEMKHVPISRDKIVFEVCDHYLRTP